MSLPNGTYRTKAGSEVRISGKHSGVASIDFDWFEEAGACCDCQPSPYPLEGRLEWSCDVCGGGFAELYPVEEAVHEEAT